MNSQDFTPTYSALQRIGDEQLTPLHRVLIGVAAVNLIAVIVSVVVLARSLACCACCNKKRPLDAKANLQSNDISAAGRNNLEETPSCKWDVKHQEKEKEKEIPPSTRIKPAGIKITIAIEGSTKVTLEKRGSDTVETKNDLQATLSCHVDKKYQEYVSVKAKPASTDKESTAVRITIEYEESNIVTLEKLGSDTVETRNDLQATPSCHVDQEYNSVKTKPASTDKESTAVRITTEHEESNKVYLEKRLMVNEEEGETEEEDQEWDGGEDNGGEDN